MRARGRGGFTLIEAAIATVVVGSGVVAVVSAQRAFHLQNEWAAQAAVAQQLGAEVRELVLGLPQRDPVTGGDLWGPEPDESGVAEYDDLDDFDGAVFDSADGTGPLNALRAPVAEMDGWRAATCTRSSSVDSARDCCLTTRRCSRRRSPSPAT